MQEGSFSSFQGYFGGSLGVPPPFQHRICEAQECRPTDFVPHRRKTLSKWSRKPAWQGSPPQGTQSLLPGVFAGYLKNTFFFRCFIADPDSRQAWEPIHYKLVLHQIQSSYLFWRVHVPLYLNPSLFTHSLKINKSRRLKDRVSFKLNFDEEDFLPCITAPRDNSCYERRIQRYQFFDSTWGVWAGN